MTETPANSSSRSLSVVEHSQKLAAGLSSYARALTFENRSRRNLYHLAGLAPRRRDRVFALLFLVSFIMCFAIPFAAGVAYYTLMVSPQYTSEIRFVVRSSAPLLSRDRYSSENVEPKAKIVQDTAVILNYFDSLAIVHDLRDNIDVQQLFGRRDIDVLSRLEADATQDDVLEYWQDQHSASVNPKSGIVELKVRAFSSDDAYDLLNNVMTLAEGRINQLNVGMWENLRQSTEQELQTAQQELESLRVRMRDMQNRTGVFDIEMMAESKLQVLTEAETQLAKYRIERTALATTLSAEATPLTELDRKIAAQEDEVQRLHSELAGPSGGGLQQGGNLADHSMMFNQLDVEMELAQDRLESAVRELEKVKLVSSLQLVYLDPFTDPTRAEESSHPKTVLSIIWVLFLCLIAWGLVAGGLVLLRNKLD